MMTQAFIVELESFTCDTQGNADTKKSLLKQAHKMLKKQEKMRIDVYASHRALHNVEELLGVDHG